MLELSPRALDGLLEPFAIERLQQIVEGVNFERPYGIFIVRGNENRKWHIGARYCLHQREPVHLWHLDVEEEQVGFAPLDGPDRLLPVGALSDHLDVLLDG